MTRVTDRQRREREPGNASRKPKPINMLNKDYAMRVSQSESAHDLLNCSVLFVDPCSINSKIHLANGLGSDVRKRILCTHK